MKNNLQRELDIRRNFLELDGFSPFNFPLSPGSLRTSEFLPYKILTSPQQSNFGREPIILDKQQRRSCRNGN